MKLQITESLLKWHLARDTQRELAEFCDKYQINREVSDYYQVDGKNCFKMKTHFANGGFVTAELVQGVGIDQHYQVLDYGLGKGTR